MICFVDCLVGQLEDVKKGKQDVEIVSFTKKINFTKNVFKILYIPFSDLHFLVFDVLDYFFLVSSFFCVPNKATILDLYLAGVSSGLVSLLQGLCHISLFGSGTSDE